MVLRRLTKKQRAAEILRRLHQHYPHATCSLDFSTTVQLLVATILSAQCTDERVNKVTPELFRRFPDALSMAEADLTELEELVRSTGFYHNKAKNIQGACRRIVAEFGGKVPNTMKDLLSLPGVARKTANVTLAHGYGIIQGVTVDTHVKRVSYLWGLSKETDPLKVEQDLMKLLPQTDWENYSIMTIFHGRAICTARKPDCEGCMFADICPAADCADRVNAQRKGL
jgi:endonuclease III